MSDEKRLSQEEIEALLHAADGDRSLEGQGQAAETGLQDAERQTLGEIGTISFGAAAGTLAALLKQPVEITEPTVRLSSSEEAYQVDGGAKVWTSVQFKDGLHGSYALAMKLQDAKAVADLMLGGTGVDVTSDLNELHLSALSEAMNQVVGTAATAMSSIFHRPIRIHPPRVTETSDAAGAAPGAPFEGQLVCVSFRFKVGSLIDSTLSQWIPLAFARELAQLARTAGSSDDSTAAQRPRQTAGVETSAGIRGEGVPSSERVVQRPEFVEFPSQKRVNPTPANLSLLYDVPLQVTVELGRTKRSIKEILELTTGSILELDKLAGEPVDIYVNQKRVALGEVVVIDENFGVRVTDIISPAERMRNLQ